MANLNSVLDQAAADHGERPAVRLDNLVLSYAELRDAAGRAASLLSSLGIEPGDRVAVMLPNVPAFPIAFYGALGAGAIIVPMNPLLKSREVAYYLGDSGAKVLFAWHEAATEAAKGAAGTGAQVLKVDDPDLRALLTGLAPAPSMADQASDDDAVILYTSGTTGTPKGAELTHANLTRNAEAIPDGWFRTGDLAKVDDDGYFFIVGRQKDLIIRGGYNVYPREIEEVLHEHEAVAEVAVIGIPHAELGEEVGAAVKLKPGLAATPAELRAFARQRVAAYKYPRHIWFVRELPKGPTGKVLHREVQPPQNLLQ